MQTLKIPYLTTQENLSLIKEYLKQYSSCLHYFYNRIQEGLSETLIKHLQLNNIELMDAWFKQSCVKDALLLKDKEHLIFGGKINFIKRLKNLITKEQYKENRLAPLYSIGTRSNPGITGNLKFHLEQDLSLIFKPNRKTKINLELKYKNKKLLKLLYLNQENRKFSLTYKLDLKFVYISFDETLLDKQILLELIENRVLALDLNPNYIGWSIVDWKSSSEFKLVKSGIYSIKKLNDKDFNLKGLHYSSESKERIYLSNKRNYETLLIAKNLINTAIYYKCQIVSIEDLNMKSLDKELGSKFNKLVNNNWNRNALVNNLSQ